ncbi:MAG: glutathione S-transferase family protein [Rhodospirillales bacterium]|nr:glutathione S-transferase family protein [Rhodospirillales bacterium]
MPDLPAPATIIGGAVSPYVRKVLAVCALKGVPVTIDPIIPFFGGDRFTAVSPLRRVPVLIDDQVTISDSAVICQYLDERYPDPPLLPSTPADRARARWLEAFAATRMSDVIMWQVFNEAVIKPGIWGRPRDVAALERGVAEALPPVLDYLEGVAPAEGYVVGPLSIADLSVAVLFRNLTWSRVTLDAARWPRTLAWVERTVTGSPLGALSALADRLVRMTPAAQREAYEAAGIPVTPDSVGEATPRRGPMTV